MLILATITERLIDLGSHDACGCPAALALAAAVPGASVLMYADHAILNGKPLNVPPPLRYWILAYDARERVEPLWFVLDTDDVWLTLAQRRWNELQAEREEDARLRRKLLEAAA